MGVARDVGDHVGVVGEQLGEGEGVASEGARLLRVPEVKGFRVTRLNRSGVCVVLRVSPWLCCWPVQGPVASSGTAESSVRTGWWPKITTILPLFSALFSSL